MRRRGIGIGAIHRQQQTEAKYKEMSETIAKQQLEKLSQQMEVFRNKLQDFAIKHKKAIKKDPEFRRSFQKMCANIGVDPLYSSTNFWTKMLGVGSIYYELAIQATEVCLALNHRTGGVIELNELYSRLMRSRSATSKSDADVSVDDVVRALEKMSSLGTGIQLLKCKDTYIIQSLSKELNVDQNKVVQLAQESDARVSLKDLEEKFGWASIRAEKAINDLIMEGVIWVDEPGPRRHKLYWFPGFFVKE